MRNRGMVAAMALAMFAGMGAAQSAIPAPRKGSSRDYDPPAPKRKPATQLEREIAEHNEAVERRKAEKKARKLARKAAGTVA